MKSLTYQWMGMVTAGLALFYAASWFVYSGARKGAADLAEWRL